jgi:peptide/nickel transport system substrate-binding protein
MKGAMLGGRAAARARALRQVHLLVLVLVLVSGLGGLTACGAGAPGGRRPTDRLVVARASDATSLDPARASDIESLEVAEQVFGRLVRFAPGRLEPEPDLATSWSVSADGTVWTFELRAGVRFHDDTPFDAEAVVFSFERQLITEHPSHEPDFVWTRSYQNIRQVKALGPLRVEFRIDRPYAPFLANLAMGPAAIVSPTAVRKWGTKFGREHPVGTGPYRFLEWIPGDRITLERNERYWDGAPKTRYLVLLQLPDARQRMQALESGTADVIQQLAPDDLSLVRLDPDLRLVSAPAALVAYLAINTQRRPLDDVRVRRAIAHAVRRDAIVRYIYQGTATPAVGPLPPNVWGARTDLVSFAYDPARARSLLAEAGFVGAGARRLRLYVPSTSKQYMPAPERVAEVVRSCLAEAGIDLEVVVRAPAELQRALWAGEHDLALTGWSAANGDPDNFLYTLLDADNTTGTRPTNVAFYVNGWFHDIIGQAQRTTDRTERERLYSQAQAIVVSEVPWVPLAHPKVIFATRANVRGLAVQPSAMALYRAAERTP